MKKSILIVVAVCMMVFHTSVNSVEASEVEVLINKLVEKGVIEQADAAAILSEVQATAVQQREQMVKETAAALQKDAASFFDIPSWVKKMRLTGDFRLRYQLNDIKGRDDRHRTRYRLRVGIITEVTDQINVGFGLISGGADPRSGNVTAGRSWDTPDIRLDYAYASYTPYDWLTLIGGKMTNPLWRVSDWLWCGDVRPEGISAKISHSVDPRLDVFFNSAFFILSHGRDSARANVRTVRSDPLMWVLQPGFDFKPIDDMYIKGSFNYYGFSNVRKNFNSPWSSRTNTRWGNSVWYNDDYDAMGTSLEIGFLNLMDEIPFVAVYGDFINNITKSSNNKGYIAGLKFGERSVRRQGQWQILGNFRRIEQDAWLDFLPDPNAYGGATNIKGWQIKTAYAFFDNVTGGLNYYSMERLRGRTAIGKKVHENVFQADIVFRF